ncbi:hypothetical protein O181_024960 [Austropuccinia psidii MF-1]|uniref:DUF159-domain-containing protein n=1 Tax=Austropuccinia psidii MF-1 TaxID=1389203 RepID=A0A9Q3H0M5_9BASI|nr:hypothetical protein [Austropuccinia psidii MF-1]
MCGRFALSLNQKDLEVALKNIGLQVDQWLNENQYRPNFNLAPQDRAAVVRRVTSKEPDLQMDCMKWGVVPHWTESPPMNGALLNTINARDDKVLESRGLWNSLKPTKRCIIPCEGFFEWQTKGKEKIPHFTKRTDGKLMCLAGLWDSVKYKGETEELHTFTIITTSSSKYLSFLHDRMPVILPDQASMEAWLDTSSSEWSFKLAGLLKPFEEESGLVCYPVPKEVGKVGVQNADFLKPISQRKGNIMSFFQKQSRSQTQSSKPPASSLAETKATGMSSSKVVKSDDLSQPKALKTEDELGELISSRRTDESHKRSNDNEVESPQKLSTNPITTPTHKKIKIEPS